MSTKTWVQDVIPGYAEYLAQAFSVGAANDYVEFEFNSPITITEMIVESTGSGSDVYELSIIYPSTEKKMVITGAQESNFNFYLNQGNKMWYYIPARGKLRATCTTYSAAFNLTLFAIGNA